MQKKYSLNPCWIPIERPKHAHDMTRQTREKSILESLYIGWRIAWSMLDRLVMFYQKTGKGFGRVNIDWKARGYKS